MSALLIHLGAVAILALAVEVACRLGRFRPAVCHALWLLVLVKLVAPPVVSWPISMEAFYSEPWRGSEIATTIETVEGARTTPLHISETSYDGAPNNSASRMPAWREGIPLSLPALLAMAWVLGSIVRGSRIFWRIRRVRQTVAAASPPPVWLQGQLVAICDQLGVPVPRAVLIDAPAGVYVQITGVPALVVSTGALDHVAAERWPAILTHEVAHLKRRDHWVAWLLLLAGAVWWWNPCYGWIRRRIHLFSELACDAWVVNTHPEGRKAYAETMVQFMTLFSRQQTPAPAMGLAAWSGADQKRRLRMIMQGSGEYTMKRTQTLALIAAAALLAPMWIAPASEDAPAPLPDNVPIEDATWVLSLAPSDAAQAFLDTPVTLSFNNTHIGDIIDSIHNSLGANLVLDQRVVAPAPVDGVDTPDRQLGCSPYVTDGLVPSVEVKSIPLKDALTAIGRPLGLMYQLRGSTVFVSSRAQLLLDQSAPLPHAVPEGSDQNRLGSVLEENPVDWDFESTHLMDVLEEIQDKFDINVVLDKRAVLRTGGDPQVSDPRWPEFKGYASDGMVREIHLKGAPLGEALYTVSRLLNVSYSVQAGFIFVSTDTIIAQDGFRKPVDNQ